MLFVLSPMDQSLAQPPLKCRGGGLGSPSESPPLLLKERDFPDIKRSLFGDFCSVAFCTEKGRRVLPGCWGQTGGRSFGESWGVPWWLRTPSQVSLPGITPAPAESQTQRLGSLTRFPQAWRETAALALFRSKVTIAESPGAGARWSRRESRNGLEGLAQDKAHVSHWCYHGCSWRCVQDRPCLHRHPHPHPLLWWLVQ